MAYKVIDRQYEHTDELSGLTEAVCAIFADEAADLPAEAECKKKGIGTGSWAWCAEEVTFATLKTDYTWKVAE